MILSSITVCRALMAALALAGTTLVNAAPGAAGDSAWLQDVAKMRTRADASLTRERGWLSIVSRDEVGPGTYRIGSGPGNDIVLPKALAPAHLGTITVGNDRAHLALSAPQKMRTVAKRDEAHEFTTRDLVTGATRVEWITSGRLSLQIVKREDGKVVVRAADRESPRRKNFAGRVWYEPKADYRVPARFVPHADGATIPIANVRGEISYEKVAGTLEFVLNGKTQKLDALDDEGDLFVIFRDGTSNSTTYPPGRFLSVEKPKDGQWMVDLNTAYNPPCAFSAFTTCPLPPPQNWLQTEVPAGERYAGRKS
jgi:hypothetical protein